MADTITDESLFPRGLRKVVNYLWRLARPLREVRGVEPIRVMVSESNIVVQFSEEAQAAILAAIEAAEAGDQTLLPGVEIYLAGSDTVVTRTIIVIE